MLLEYFIKEIVNEKLKNTSFPPTSTKNKNSFCYEAGQLMSLVFCHGPLDIFTYAASLLLTLWAPSLFRIRGSTSSWPLYRLRYGHWRDRISAPVQHGKQCFLTAEAGWIYDLPK